MANSSEQLKAAISNVLGRRFKNVEIVELQIDEDVDFDGDDILKVSVIFKSDGPLDSDETKSVVRHLRPELAKLNEWRFPLMSFISKDDYLGEHAAIA